MWRVPVSFFFLVVKPEPEEKMLKRYGLAILLVFVSSFTLSHDVLTGHDIHDRNVLAPMHDADQTTPVDFAVPERSYNVRGDTVSTLVAKPVHLMAKEPGVIPPGTFDTASLPFEVGWRSC